MVFSHTVWLKTGVGIPVPEAAASHWFTWALGAVGVEAWFGLLKLPRWTSNLKLATVLIVMASALSNFLPSLPKDTLWHNGSWFLIHPLWGLGFFMVVNRMVLAEDSWLRGRRLPLSISLFSMLGVFSYSIYLTHELTIMQSWRWTNPAASKIQNVFLIVIPAVILFAWTFFWFCEKPFMRSLKISDVTATNEPQLSDNLRPPLPILDHSIEASASAGAD
jgi:peptidoglycan/LPS O-acetylase OafA/YrhL